MTTAYSCEIPSTRHCQSRIERCGTKPQSATSTFNPQSKPFNDLSVESFSSMKPASQSLSIKKLWPEVTSLGTSLAYYPSTQLMLFADKITCMSEQSEFASEPARSITKLRCRGAPFAHFSLLKTKSEASACPPTGIKRSAAAGRSQKASLRTSSN